MRRLPLALLSLAVGGLLACSVPTEGAVRSDEAELEAMALPGVDERLMDRSIDPCQDFYGFVCGNYASVQPPGTVRASRFGDLTQQRQVIVGEIVEGLKTAPRNETERKASAFTASCMEQPDARARDYLVGFRREIEAAASLTDVMRIVAKMHRAKPSHSHPLFAFLPTTSEGRRSSVGMQPGGYDYFQTDYANPEMVAGRVAKTAAEIRVADPQMFESDALRLAQAAVALEKQLADASAGESSLDARPLGQRGLEVVAPHLDWATYFHVLGAPDDLGEFPIWRLDWFAALDGILSTASLVDIKAYLVAQLYAPMASLLAPGDRTQLCQGYLMSKLADVVEPRFLEAAGVDEHAQGKARALYRAIVAEFDKELRVASFLDATTRAEAVVKLAKMGEAIAASRELDDLRGYEVDPDASWIENNVRLNERNFARALETHDAPPDLDHVSFPAPAVNAGYYPGENRVVIPGGILGGFFFSPAAPAFANFAAVGTVMGHEITHGFDSRGRQFDGNGAFRDWWSPAVNAEFERRAQCLVDQYDAFVLPGVVDPATGQLARVNGKNTLGENIADAGGLKLAFRASKVQGRNAGQTVAGFTPVQQFFVGYGQNYCEISPPESVLMQVQRGVHSPGRARVTLPLANMPEFAEAFQCAAGTPMAPVDRCQVW